ncbi:unnamed protein product, partial [Discosporangium mesarthrocarpum]
PEEHQVLGGRWRRARGGAGGHLREIKAAERRWWRSVGGPWWNRYLRRRRGVRKKFR